MLDGRVLGASQVEYKPFVKLPLKREALDHKLLILATQILPSNLQTPFFLRLEFKWPELAICAET